MAIVYLCIGSNIGNKIGNLKKAVELLKAAGNIDVIARSEFYVTEPVGGPSQEDYLNGVLKVKTAVSPDELIVILKKIERNMGRNSAGRNYPRVIDIDILLYDDVVMDTDILRIPHPRMHERYFVLKGLAEIAPDIIHPIIGKTALELYSKVKR